MWMDYNVLWSIHLFHHKDMLMAIDLASTRILITGANGFIGLHTVLHFLKAGYNLCATVRIKEHGDNVRKTLAKHTDTQRLEFVHADLLRDEGWDQAVAGCDFVLHVASPFPSEAPKDENDLIRPAREGTLRVLHAAQKAGVKRMVVVSSTAAVTAGHERENRTFDESDWTNLDKTNYAYAKSKTLAEQAAWEFIRGTENRNGMQLAVVNPSNVFGPVLDNRHHTSTEWFLTLLRREVPGLTRTQLNLVDVRDVVDLLEKAMLTPEAAGKRFLANGASIPVQEFALILDRNFASRGYRVPTRILPDWLIRFFAIFIPKTKPVVDALDWNHSLSTEQARTLLGWQPRAYQGTIVEMAESMMQQGMV
jgi:dihydroflavonol-4-reductase